MEGGSLWSPYYRITVFQDNADTVVEVNHIFHQSMAPVAQKEYFYQWPYTVFGDTFDEVLILGAGSGTDVAAALRHGAKHVTAVDIDPVILRLGAERHPDKPYSDPRVTVVSDDARHFLRTTTKQYDLVVFALIDSLTVQSSFSGVRLESYMFTKESFEAVRERLSPRGVMVLYNYFREKWLVDRLANTSAAVFGRDPLGHVHQDRAYLAVMLAGPRVAELTAPPPLPPDVLAYGQSHAPSPAHPLARDASVVRRHRQLAVPLHARARAAAALPRGARAGAGRVGARRVVARGQIGERRAGRGTSSSSAPGFMLLETKSIVQFALLWGSTWSSASLAIASVLVMALASALVASRVEIRRAGPDRRRAARADCAQLPRSRSGASPSTAGWPSRSSTACWSSARSSAPACCSAAASRSRRRRPTISARTCSGAMVGGVGEYLSLLAGYQFLLILVAAATSWLS